MGTADEIIPSESSQLYVQRIPNSYRIFIFGAAHSLPVAACRQFVTLATDFLQRGEGFVVNQLGRTLAATEVLVFPAHGAA